QAHGAILAKLQTLAPRQMADIFLALATHQRCPITLLEELQPRLSVEMAPEEALTTAWAMVAMGFTASGHLPALVDCAARAQLSPPEVKQMQQIILSMELAGKGAPPRSLE
ncbi:unnamed protein product, partial [Effrenium voratum]